MAWLGNIRRGANETPAGQGGVASGLQAACRKGWAALCAAPLWRWLGPVVWVEVWRTDGQRQSWMADAQTLWQSPAPRATSRFIAVEVPEALFLARDLTLPAMSRAQAAAAATLQAQSISPFAEADLLCACDLRPLAATNGWAAQVVLASRSQVAAWLAARHMPASAPASASGPPEVWAWLERGPLVLPGFGESTRSRRLRTMAWWHAAGCVAAVGWLAAMAITPVWQLRHQALAAAQAFEQLSKDSAPAMAARDALLRANAQLKDLSAGVGTKIEPVALMAFLSRALPDDTSLITVGTQGRRVTIAGQTSNAAALMSRLSAEASVKDVKAPSAAVKPPGASKESFVLEFTWVAPAANSPSAAPVTPAAPAPVTAPVAAASAPQAAASAAPVAASGGGVPAASAPKGAR